MLKLLPLTHTHTASYEKLPTRIYVEIIALVKATYLRNGRYHVEEIQKYLDAQQHLWLHCIGLHGQVNRKKL